MFYFLLMKRLRFKGADKQMFNQGIDRQVNIKFSGQG